MDFNQLVDKTHAWAFEYDGFTINVEAFKNKICSSYREQVAAELSEGADELHTFRLLADSLKSWDVTKGGEEFPPTVENLRQMPDSFIVALGKVVLEGGKENPTQSASE